jgi:hypothetical protein
MIVVHAMRRDGGGEAVRVFHAIDDSGVRKALRMDTSLR